MVNGRQNLHILRLIFRDLCQWATFKTTVQVHVDMWVCEIKLDFYFLFFASFCPFMLVVCTGTLLHKRKRYHSPLGAMAYTHTHTPPKLFFFSLRFRQALSGEFEKSSVGSLALLRLLVLTTKEISARYLHICNCRALSGRAWVTSPKSTRILLGARGKIFLFKTMHIG